MAGGLAAELAGAFGEPDPDALGVHLDDLALPLGALDQESNAASGVSPDLHPNLCVLHVRVPPSFCCVYITVLCAISPRLNES